MKLSYFLKNVRLDPFAKVRQPKCCTGEFDDQESHTVEEGTSRLKRYQRATIAYKHVFALLADLEPSRDGMELKVLQEALEAFVIYRLDSKSRRACATAVSIADLSPAATKSNEPAPTQQSDFPNTQPFIPSNATFQLNRQRARPNVVQRVNNPLFNVSRALQLSVATTTADTVTRNSTAHSREEPLQLDHG